MKKHLKVTLMISFVFIMVLTACSSTPTPTAAVVPPNVVVQATAVPTKAVVVEPAATQAVGVATAYPAPVKLSDAEMEALIVEKLKGSPHTLEFVLSQNKTAAEWEKTLTKMIGNGAKINAEEKKLLVDWLSSRK